MKLLRVLSFGAEVKTLQTALVARGFDCGGIDGYFGPRTLAAVKAYQKSAGLDADGVVGPMTWADLLADPSTAVKPETEHFTLAEYEVHDKALESIWTPVPVQYYPDLQLLFDHLEVFRHKMGDIPIIIRSGYRGHAYNTKTSGDAGLGSQHIYAAAADIYFPGHSPTCYVMGKAAYDYFCRGGIGGVGLGANVNVHVDIRNIKNCSPRTRATYWWYNYPSWATWEANQN